MDLGFLQSPPSFEWPLRSPPKGRDRSDSSHEVFFPYSVSPLGAAASSGRVCLARPPAPPGFLNLLAR
jgi:hypothetical protein